MTATNSLVTPQTPKAYKYQLKNADGTTAQTLAPGPTAGTKIYGMWAASTDTANRDVQITVLRSGVTYLQTTITVPLSAGNVAGTPPVNFMTAALWPGLATDPQGNLYFHLESTDTLQVNAVVTITSGKLISVNCIAADFA